MPEDGYSVIKTCHSKAKTMIIQSSCISTGCLNAKSIALKKQDNTLVLSTERREQRHWSYSSHDFTTLEYSLLHDWDSI